MLLLSQNIYYKNPTWIEIKMAYMGEHFILFKNYVLVIVNLYIFSHVESSDKICDEV